ncbi:hypothetical protein C0991_004008 [Blastosporella zonata]|nr:hypothetical protein C0991_004008 [Blastosporella zonata]
MLSFRTTFLVALAAFTSAAPIAPGLGSLTGSDSIANGLGGTGTPNVHQLGVQGINLVNKRDTTLPPQIANLVAGLTQHARDAPSQLDLLDALVTGVTGKGIRGRDAPFPPPVDNLAAGLPQNAPKAGALTLPIPTKTRRNDAQLQTLPEILIGAAAQLTVVASNLNGASAGKTEVDTQILVNVIGDVQAILCAALDAVKLLVGSPIDFILTLDGKVLALVDVCRLLLTVVSVVCVILSCVLKLVASASLHVITPLVAGVSTVLCQLLQCIFTLVPGLVASLGPSLGPIVSILTTLKLDVVIRALHDTSANGKPNVDVKILVGIVGDVQTILCTLLDGVKLIIGHPIDFVLCLDGKVLALVDVCALLTSVLSLVCVILSCVIRLVGSANLHIVAPLVAGVGAVLCELLPCIFQLVPGILVALSPVSGTIINAFIGLKLDAVATLLKAH